MFLPRFWGAIPALSFIGKLTVPRRHGGRLEVQQKFLARPPEFEPRTNGLIDHRYCQTELQENKIFGAVTGIRIRTFSMAS